MTETNQLVNKLWNYCDILREDGLSYGDYVEQLTFLLFLKMDDERSKPPYNKSSDIPEKYNWQSLLEKEGAELESHYVELLRELGKEEGIIGVIFRKAQNKISDPAKLKKLIHMIDDENWLSMKADIKGDLYEDLLQKNAEDVKSGAGQYFTPRPLINSIVRVMGPEPGQKIHDPACGTGGFLLSANNYILDNYNPDRDQKEFLQKHAFSGEDIVPNTARLCVMNLYLHGISSHEETPVKVEDSLKRNPGAIYDMVLTNPPFGKKSTEKFTTEEGELAEQKNTVLRDDFWAESSNKQLNFLQHIKSILKINGKAAVVLPDNVLFEGGAGETVRKKLMETCDLHTILRLPTGIFYKPGVKANVLFFDKREASKEAQTKEVWIYDLRTNMNFTLKENPLKEKDLEDFIKCFNPENRHKREERERFKCFSYEEILKRDKTNLDIFWLKDESLEDLENLPEPDEISQELVGDLNSALEELKEVNQNLNNKY